MKPGNRHIIMYGANSCGNRRFLRDERGVSFLPL